jgi:hypothetical protein
MATHMTPISFSMDRVGRSPVYVTPRGNLEIHDKGYRRSAQAAFDAALCIDRKWASASHHVPFQG